MQGPRIYKVVSINQKQFFNLSASPESASITLSRFLPLYGPSSIAISLVGLIQTDKKLIA